MQKKINNFKLSLIVICDMLVSKGTRERD